MSQQKTTVHVFFFLHLFGTSLSSTLIYQAQEGEQVSLDLGPNIVTWGRVRNNIKEFIRYCGDKDTVARCHQFMGEEHRPSNPITNAHVNKNGTLVIESFKATDVGDYFSLDELERIQINKDGTYWSTPRTQISVVL